MGGFGDGEDDSIEGHFSARARVAGLWDLAEPRRQLDDDDIELLLGGPVAPTEPPEAQRLDEVETALRQVREEVQATAPRVAARAAACPATAPDGLAPALGQASADAIAQLGVDIARLVEVVDCGFERLEAVGDQQAVDLRTDVARMLDELAGRLGHADPTIAAEADAEPHPTVASEEPVAESPPTTAWDDSDAEFPPVATSDDTEAASSPVIDSVDADVEHSSVIESVNPEAEHSPVVASDDTEAAPLPLLASDDAHAEPMPAVASGDPDAAQPDDAHADPRPTAGWDDDDLFDEPADMVSTAPAAPFGRAFARADLRDDIAVAATVEAGGEPEAGGWSEASAEDFERHMETSAAPPMYEGVSGETELADHPPEAEPAPAANPDKGFSWLRFPGSKLLRKRVA